jgi:tetratricopeptide (TPR) repeat protein
MTPCKPKQTTGVSAGGHALAAALSALLLVSTAAPRIAAAEPPGSSADPADEAEALQLFRRARASLEKGDQIEACRLFRQSANLKTSPGTLLNIGACYVLESKPAEAFETFEQALDLAQRAPDAVRRNAWSEAAERELAALRLQLAEVTLRFTPAPDLEMRLNDTAIDIPSEPLRLKPGEYQLQVSAPGRKRFDRHFTATAGARLELPIPALQRTVPLAPAPGPEQVEAPASTSVVPWVLMGTGAATLGASIVTGVMSSNRQSWLDSHCPNHHCPESGWQKEIDSFHRLTRATGILLGLGIATSAVGVGWLLLDRSNQPAPANSVVASCLGDFCGLVARGRF